jgi:hypothetical protein
MRALILFSIFLLAFNIYAAANCVDEEECLFIGCECETPNPFVTVNCYQNKTINFPLKSNKSSTAGVYYYLRFYDYNVTEISDKYFENLNVVELTIQRSNLKIIKKDTFYGIKDLKALVLKENKINSIEKNSFEKLHLTLKLLDFSDNQLTSETFSQMMIEISKLGRLENLFLINNMLTYLRPEWLASLSDLSELYLSHNNIRTLNKTTFQKNKKLTKLYIDYNQLNDSAQLLDALSPLKSKLAELNLNANPMNYSISLLAFGNLRSLSLANNNLTSFDSKPNSDVLPMNLELLDLSNNYLSRTPNLVNLHNMKSLQIYNQNSRLTDIGDYAFERGVLAYLPLEISLRQNNITSFGNRAFCSNSSKINPISSLEIDYYSMKYLNKCVIKQLRLFVYEEEEIMLSVYSASPLDPTTLGSVCDCGLIKFLQPFNIKLTGQCENVTCANAFASSLKDDCDDQYSCLDPFATSTISTKSTTKFFSTSFSFTTRKITTSSDLSRTLANKWLLYALCLVAATLFLIII